MRLRYLALTTMIVSALGGLSQAEVLKLDAEKSKIEFVGKKPSNDQHKGGFKKFEVECSADFDAPEKSTLNVVIFVDSIFTDNQAVTDHLKNPDFYDVRKFPKIEFKSTKIEISEEEGKATVIGKLKMIDKEVEVKIPITVVHTDERLTMKATFKIDRTKWGFGPKFSKEMINNDVEITSEFNFKR